MNIKNYTSTTDAMLSMAKIESKLVAIGASNISKKYEDKICTAITFLYTDAKLGKTYAFQLRAQVNECYKILFADIKRPKPDTKARVMEQANRTAWKILFDWTEVQCTMILLGQAEPLQMFLPFVYDMATDETFYQKIQLNTKLLSISEGI